MQKTSHNRLNNGDTTIHRKVVTKFQGRTDPIDFGGSCEERGLESLSKRGRNTGDESDIGIIGIRSHIVNHRTSIKIFRKIKLLEITNGCD